MSLSLTVLRMPVKNTQGVRLLSDYSSLASLTAFLKKNKKNWQIFSHSPMADLSYLQSTVYLKFSKNFKFIQMSPQTI